MGTSAPGVILVHHNLNSNVDGHPFTQERFIFAVIPCPFPRHSFHTHKSIPAKNTTCPNDNNNNDFWTAEGNKREEAGQDREIREEVTRQNRKSGVGPGEGLIKPPSIKFQKEVTKNKVKNFNTNIQTYKHTRIILTGYFNKIFNLT